VILEYTVDEELSGNGTLACVMKGYKADAGICCETSSMRVQPGSIGRIWFEIQVKGKAAGIQRRWEGVNAIDKGYRVTQAVAEFERLRVGRVSHPLYPDIRGAIPCMVGVFESGSYPSAFPDSCFTERVHGHGSRGGLGRGKKRIRRIHPAKSRRRPLDERPPSRGCLHRVFRRASAIPADSPIVRALCRKFTEVTGKEPMISGREGAADIRFMNRYGDTPTVIFGPGMTEQMHANNEWASMDDLIQATKILSQTILEWCRVA